VQGRLRLAEVRLVQSNSVLAYEVADSTGDLTVLFYGRGTSRASNAVAGSGCTAWSASVTTAIPR
jgi:hypothetical protein